MPTSVPVPDKAAGDVFTEAMWDSYLRDNINKLLDKGHRVLTVAQFAALTGLEDGDEVYLEVDATNGIMWHVRYVAAEPTYKWRFLGGPELSAEIQTNEATTASATYQDLATVGPQITAQRAGQYALVVHSRNVSGTSTWASAKLGAAAAADADAAKTGPEDGCSRQMIRTLAASDVVKVQYRPNSAVASGIEHRSLHMRPVRIS